jgi:hypothetical protein
MLSLPMCLGIALTDLKAAELLSNGSFADGQVAWARLGPQVTLSSAPDARPGVRALRVARRSQRNDGPVQDVLAPLLEVGSGRRLFSRFEVKADLPSSARALLEFRDDTDLRRVILAEKVIREAGVWGRIEGSTRVVWQGTLRQARLHFEVARVPEREYPDYCLTAVSLQLDTDGDGLSDDDERATGTDPARPIATRTECQTVGRRPMVLIPFAMTPGRMRMAMGSPTIRSTGLPPTRVPSPRFPENLPTQT